MDEEKKHKQAQVDVHKPEQAQLVSDATSEPLVSFETMVWIAVALAWVCWASIVIVGFAYFGRGATRSGDRFRLSLGFALASVVFPPFAMVPVCLNARD